jgi:hypothetical protein
LKKALESFRQRNTTAVSPRRAQVHEPDGVPHRSWDGRPLGLGLPARKRLGRSLDDVDGVTEPFQDVGHTWGAAQVGRPGCARFSDVGRDLFDQLGPAVGGQCAGRRRQPSQVVGNELIVVVINHRRISCSGLWQLARRLVGRRGPGQWVLGRAGQQLVNAVAQLPPRSGEIGESVPPGRGEPPLNRVNTPAGALPPCRSRSSWPLRVSTMASVHCRIPRGRTALEIWSRGQVCFTGRG